MDLPDARKYLKRNPRSEKLWRAGCRASKAVKAEHAEERRAYAAEIDRLPRLDLSSDQASDLVSFVGDLQPEEVNTLIVAIYALHGGKDNILNAMIRKMKRMAVQVRRLETMEPQLIAVALGLVTELERITRKSKNTDRNKKIVEMKAKGHSAGEIAKSLGLTANTVDLVIKRHKKGKSRTASESA